MTKTTCDFAGFGCSHRGKPSTHFSKFWKRSERHDPKTNPGCAHSDLPISSYLRHSSFELPHFYQAALCNSLCNHAFAKTQSRRTVTVEIFRTSAISSCLRPPKYFNSTT